MPAPTRKSLLASRRRRRPEEGEEEESVLGDFEEDSLSEGSAVSNGDDEAEFEGSESSGDEHEPTQATVTTTSKLEAHGDRNASAPVASTSDVPKPDADAFKPSAETDAMLHGLSTDQQAQDPEQLHFDDLPAVPDTAEPPKAPRNETPAQRARREHQEYVRQRDANPAFVPTRGGFFLHDDRNSNSMAPGGRPFVRGRGRGAGPPLNISRPTVINEPTSKPWAHDLHEDHENKAGQVPPRETAAPSTHEAAVAQSKSMPAVETPNRSFSFTTVLGNVNVQISLPGMAQNVNVSNVVKKNHTLLPQHRPPLRRDKPVRISLPNAAPRYIFPSTDRSFIFIPRALRPNQQTYSTRGRGGRGSFHGSRRPSIYGAYTPSVAMSRKSSLGASTMREGIISPTESVMSRHIPGVVDGSRPVVRLPSVGPPPVTMPGLNGHIPVPISTGPPMSMPPQVMMYGNHPAVLTMHQPRPQKTVSVADIESPASFPFTAPQQQQEQPFHQQVPVHMANPSADDKSGAPPVQPPMPAAGGVTPLSQIPEGAVFAPGFQPLPIGGQGFYGAPYHNGPVFYPPVPDVNTFGLQMGGAASAPNFVPGSQSHPINYMPPTGHVDSSMVGSMMAHESHGMVFYYNQPAFTPDGQSGMQQFPMQPNGPLMGMPPQGHFYYPTMPAAMFYPAQTG